MNINHIYSATRFLLCKRLMYNALPIIIATCLQTLAWAQIDSLFPQKNMPYAYFISLVGKNNKAYAAEKFNLPIAEANIISAGIFPDPELGFSYFDNNQRRLGMGYGFESEFTWTIELGGKRKARKDLARNEYELTRLLLLDFFRNLRADATLQYLQAMQNRLILEVLASSYQTMKRLAQTDSIRFKIGAITEVDARQSKLEAGTMLNDVFQAEAEWKMMLAALLSLTGTAQSDTLPAPSGNFNAFDRNFSLNDLITTAQNNRADLLAALQSQQVAQSLLQLAKANRVIDMGLSLSGTYASYTRNIIAPTPSFMQVAAGVSVPLKLSNYKPVELKSAYYGTLQAEAQYRQVELDIQREITQAYFNYLAQQKKVQQFNNGLLNEAKAVLDGKIYSYQRGETSLLEVLNAQRTYNEVQISYYQTLYNNAAALVELERAAGIWDINF